MKALLLNLAILSIVLSPKLTTGQSEKILLDKEMPLEKTSTEIISSFKVEKGTKQLIIDFNANISEGSLKIDIKDPYGNEISGLMLRTSGKKGSNYTYTENELSATSSSNASSSSTSSSSSSSSKSRTSSSTRTSSKASEKSDNKINNYIMTTANTESDSKGSRGVLAKEIKNPAEGQWVFYFQPKEATGNLKMKISIK